MSDLQSRVAVEIEKQQRDWGIPPAKALGSSGSGIIFEQQLCSGSVPRRRKDRIWREGYLAQAAINGVHPSASRCAFMDATLRRSIISSKSPWKASKIALSILSCAAVASCSGREAQQDGQLTTQRRH